VLGVLVLMAVSAWSALCARPASASVITPLSNVSHGSLTPQYMSVNYTEGPAFSGSGYGVAFDPDNGAFYISANNSTLTVINESTWQPVGYMPVPSGWYSKIAIDPIHDLGFVAGGEANGLTVFNTTTLKVVKSYPGVIDPQAIALDTLREIAIFTNGSSLVFFNYATWTVLGVSNVGIAYKIAIDPTHDVVAVTSGSPNNQVMFFNETSQQWMRNITCVANPGPIVYDPASNNFITVNYDSNNFSLISDTSTPVVQNFTVPSPGWDPEGVVVVNGGADEVLIWEYYDYPGGWTLQPFDIANDTFLAPTNNPYSGWPANIAIDPKTLVAVGVDPLGNQTVPFVPDLTNLNMVTFNEVGLPGGTYWCADVSTAVTCSSTSNIYFYEPLGTFPFTIGQVQGYVATPSSGSIVLSTGPASQTIVFSQEGPSYPVSFTETGLPTGTSWYVSLNGMMTSSTTSTITFNEANGAYSYSVETPIASGSWTLYAGSPSSGVVTVSGVAQNQPVAYTEQFLLTMSASPSSGGTLGPGTGWYDAGSIIGLDATPASGSTFTSWVGTGPGAYSGTDNPASLTLTASDNETAVFNMATYTVTFNENGLPSGTQWGVTVAGVPEVSATSSVVFSEPNGTYQYSIQTPIKTGVWEQYVTTPASGSFTVTGSVISMTATYSEQFWLSVAVSPSGAGTASPATGWYGAGTTVELAASATNGSTFSNWVGAGPGNYTGTSNPDSLTLIGSDNETAFFTAETYTVYFTEVGLPLGTQWAVTFAGVLSTSTTGSISFVTTAGTYGYSIETPISVGVWSQYVSSSPSGSIIIAGNGNSIQVTYAEQFLLTVGVGQSGGGTVSPASGWYYANSVVDLVATAASGYQFETWVGTGPGAYSGSDSTQNFTLTGSDNETAIFAEDMYIVTFLESNLSPGTQWGVTLNGQSSLSTTTAVTFSMPDGTYHYSVSVPSGYSSTTSSGSVTVSGHALTVNVAFQQKSTTSGTSYLDYWLMLGAAIVVCVILFAMVTKRKRSRSLRQTFTEGRAPSPTTPSPPQLTGEAEGPDPLRGML